VTQQLYRFGNHAHFDVELPCRPLMTELKTTENKTTPVHQGTARLLQTCSTST